VAVAIPSLLPDAAQEIGRKYQQFSVYEYGKMGKHAVICAERGREVVNVAHGRGAGVGLG